MSTEGNPFPKKLKQIREKKGISRRVLSELSGLSKNMISLYERGKCEPTYGAIIRIAEALRVSPEDFYYP